MLAETSLVAIVASALSAAATVGGQIGVQHYRARQDKMSIEAGAFVRAASIDEGTFRRLESENERLINRLTAERGEWEAERLAFKAEIDRLESHVRTMLGELAELRRRANEHRPPPSI